MPGSTSFEHGAYRLVPAGFGVLAVDVGAERGQPFELSVQALLRLGDRLLACAGARQEAQEPRRGSERAPGRGGRGSLLAGVIAGLTASAALAAELQVIVAGGFLGAYTTFSTAMYESMRLAEDGARIQTLANLLAPLGLSVVAATLGWLMVA